jgi:hypothetical protein
MAISPNTDFTSGQVLTAQNANQWPRGVMGLATVTSSVVSAQNIEITLASVSFTAVANRNYRISFQAGSVTNNNSVIQNTYIRLDTTSGTILNQTETFIVAGQNLPNSIMTVTTLTAGTRTIFARAFQSSTGLATTYTASATRPMILVVEDIGLA